ncbi:MULTISPECIES: type II toxin-antitoxin system RelE/ParE family toxin [unclassified Streptomyces]|uniref:type II toxin-antitoxin system RelE family toxin n=1 Tax=unclassified Streptomyces TaxID=2593676 RepID=UPI001F26220D|nr:MULTISPECIES: type II toxin-antitoxin system RelE/ParE family toxin [unclassified Streptomyces]
MRRSDLRDHFRASRPGLRHSLDEPAHNPRPVNSVAYGVDIRRLRVGDYRVLYVIDDEVIHILVTHLGRTA